MNKKRFNLTKISVFILLILFLLFNTFVYYTYKTDNVLYYAWEDRPLDGKHIYIIEKNEALWNKDKNKPTIATGSAYIIRVPGESPKHSIVISGKVVGKTDVELEQYIGKKVWINGEYFWGKRLFLSNVTSEFDRNVKTVVAHVKSVKIVNLESSNGH